MKTMMKIILMVMIVRYLNIGNANMEEGSFRCDANVSIRKKGTEKLNEKVEIKNDSRSRTTLLFTDPRART